jgi:hypothetical protein
VQGRVLAAGGTSVTLDIEGDRVEFDYSELGPGQVQIEFGRTGTGDTGPALDPLGAGIVGGQDGH